MVGSKSVFKFGPRGRVRVKARGAPPGPSVFAEIGHSVRNPEFAIQIHKLEVFDLVVKEIEAGIGVNDTIVGVGFGRFENSCQGASNVAGFGVPFSLGSLRGGQRDRRGDSLLEESPDGCLLIRVEVREKGVQRGIHGFTVEGVKRVREVKEVQGGQGPKNFL